MQPILLLLAGVGAWFLVKPFLVSAATTPTPGPVPTPPAAPMPYPLVIGVPYPVIPQGPAPGTQAALVAHVNAVRAAGGRCSDGAQRGPVGPVVLNLRLSAAAQALAVTLAQTGAMTHSPGGASLQQRVAATGYGPAYMNESLARNYLTPQTVLQAWLDSQQHCQNVFAPEATEAGVGVAAAANNGNVWVLILARPAAGATGVG